MIGCEYSPTDLASPLIGLLGHTVTATHDGETHTGTLADVRENGTAAIEGYDGLCVAVVPASTIQKAR